MASSLLLSPLIIQLAIAWNLSITPTIPNLIHTSSSFISHWSWSTKRINHLTRIGSILIYSMLTLLAFIFSVNKEERTKGDLTTPCREGSRAPSLREIYGEAYHLLFDFQNKSCRRIPTEPQLYINQVIIFVAKAKSRQELLTPLADGFVFSLF